MNPDLTHLERWIRIWIEKYATGSELKSSCEGGLLIHQYAAYKINFQHYYTKHWKNNQDPSFLKHLHCTNTSTPTKKSQIEPWVKCSSSSCTRAVVCRISCRHQIVSNACSLCSFSTVNDMFSSPPPPFSENDKCCFLQNFVSCCERGGNILSEFPDSPAAVALLAIAQKLQAREYDIT